MLIIITKDLLCSQLNYEIFGQLLKYKGNAALVTRNLTQNFFPVKFPIINYSKIFSGYLDEKSLIVATDLDSALALTKVRNKAKKIFYVWELEYLKNKNFGFSQPTYSKLPVYTRSQSYKEALDNYANIDSEVVDLNLEKIWKKNMS